MEKMDSKSPAGDCVVNGVEVLSSGQDEHNVFSDDAQVNFRTLGWMSTAVLFLKTIFAIGVLSIPAGMSVLGAVPGAILCLAWGVICTYFAYTMGKFRENHPSIHSIADAAHLIGGPIAREIVGGVFLITWVMCVGIALLTASIGLNAVSGGNKLCTVAWTAISAIIVASLSSIRTLKGIGPLAWAGFISIFVAVFVVVVGVTKLDRPAGAPQSGDFTLGFNAVNHPDFVSGISAAGSFFTAFGGTTSFIPIIAEMRKPKDYNKALFSSLGFTTACYISFGLVIYAYCGTWLASPALGSAGPLLKKISYGISLPSLFITATLYQHNASKYLMVRILRGTQHLQSNSPVHWITWLSCTFGLTFIAFIIAEGIPFFNYLLGIVGSIFFAPLLVTFPAIMYLWDNESLRKGSATQKMNYWFHVFLGLVGCFMMVAGGYGSILSVINAFATGTQGTAFSCADNSNTAV